MKIDYYSIVDIERNKITKSTEVLDEFISREVLLTEEISLISFSSRVSESSILARISKFSLILIIVDRKIIKSSLSIKESRVFLIIIIFNNNDIAIVDLVKSFEPFSSLNILLFLLDDTSSRVISSIEDSEAIFTQ